MRRYDVVCDRCGAEITRGRREIRVETGAVTRRVFAKQVDLCEGCASDFERFMAERGQAYPPPEVGVQVVDDSAF